VIIKIVCVVFFMFFMPFCFIMVYENSLLWAN
jgi:hypothetical protein